MNSRSFDLLILCQFLFEPRQNKFCGTVNIITTMMMKLLYLSPFVLAATLFLLQVVHGQQQQYCVKQTVYKESTKCDGTDSISGYMPVSNNPADSCRTYCYLQY